MTSAEPIRIARIITRLNVGGPAIQAITLSEQLESAGYHTLLIHGRVGSGEGDMSYLIPSTRRFAVEPLNNLLREIAPLSDAAALSTLVGRLREFRPHIVHTHMLIRQDRLYAGYGVIFIVGTIAAIIVLAVPPLLRAATDASVALMPVPSLSLVAIVLLTFLVVYVFIQISVLSNRVMRLTQELAIRRAEPDQQGDAAASNPPGPVR